MMYNIIVRTSNLYSFVKDLFMLKSNTSYIAIKYKFILIIFSDGFKNIIIIIVLELILKNYYNWFY